VKLKLWLRRHSISAPKMTIKSDLPWPLKVAFIGMVLGLGGAVAIWTYDMGPNIAGLSSGMSTKQAPATMEQVNRLTAERDQFSAAANAVESQLNIERSAQKQLAAQVKALEAENAKLKEDLAFFESLLPTNTGAHGVAIRRIKAEIVGLNQLHYRLLIMQGRKGEREFIGSLQFAVMVVQAGKSAMIIFPNGKSTDINKFKLGFKHYQHVEGILTLPEGVSVKAVQVRVLENGQIRAQQSANL